MGRTPASKPPDPPPSRGGLVCSYVEQNLVHSSGDFYGRPLPGHLAVAAEHRVEVPEHLNMRVGGKHRLAQFVRVVEVQG